MARRPAASVRDRHGAYVALSRHRDGVALRYGCDDFADQRQLTRTLPRDRAKDMAGDYLAPSEHAGGTPSPSGAGYARLNAPG